MNLACLTRRAELHDLILPYINGSAVLSDRANYQDILEQQGLFSTDALLAERGIERGILFCHQLFDERCGLQFIHDHANQLLVRIVHDAPERFAPQDWSKEHAVILALSLLESALQYLDRAVPISRVKAFAAGLKPEEVLAIKGKWVQSLRAFAYLAMQHDGRPSIKTYLQAFYHQLITCLSECSLRSVDIVMRSLSMVRVCLPLAYQVYDVVTINRILETYTMQMTMSEPERWHLVVLALVSLAHRVPGFSEYTPAVTYERIQAEVQRRSQYALTLDEVVQELRPSVGAMRAADFFPQWYLNLSSMGQALLVPQLEQLLQSRRWIIPTHWPDQEELWLPPKNFFLMEMGHWDQESASHRLALKIDHEILHGGALSQGITAQARYGVWRVGSIANHLNRQGSLLTLFSPTLRRFTREPDDVIWEAMRAAVSAYNREQERQKAEGLVQVSMKLKLSNVALYEKGPNTFNYVQFRATDTWIRRFALALIAPISNVCGPLKRIGAFLTFAVEEQDISRNHFQQVRMLFSTATEAMQEIKNAYFLQSSALPRFTFSQIMLLEAMVAYLMVVINQYHKKTHKVAKWLTWALGRSGLEHLMNTVPLPSVIEMIPGRAARVNYSQWRAVLSAIIGYHAGAFRFIDPDDLAHQDLTDGTPPIVERKPPVRCNRIGMVVCKSGKDRTGYILTMIYLLTLFYSHRCKLVTQRSAGAPPDLAFSLLPNFADGSRDRVAALCTDFICRQRDVLRNYELSFMAGYFGGTSGCFGMLQSAARLLSTTLVILRPIFTGISRLNKSIGLNARMVGELEVVVIFYPRFLALLQKLSEAHETPLTATQVNAEIGQAIFESSESVVVKRIARRLVERMVVNVLSSAEQRALGTLLMTASQPSPRKKLGAFVWRRGHVQPSDRTHLLVPTSEH